MELPLSDLAAPDLGFRRPGPDDHATLAGLLDEWWGGRRIRQRLPRFWLVHFAGTSWLAETGDGRPAGFVVGFVSPGRPEEAVVHLLGVNPNLRRRGVGRQLVAAFEADARAAGCRRLVVAVPPDDRPAVTFLRRVGFEADAGPGSESLFGVPAYPDYDGEREDRAILSRPVAGS